MKQAKKKSAKSYASVMLFVTLILLGGSTFAWSSYTSWKKNHMQSVREKTPSVEVKGDLKTTILTTNKVADKNIYVSNNGEIPVFVRVTLTEELLPFVIDMVDKTGNGNINYYDDKGKISEVKLDTPSTWIKGGRYLDATSNKYIEALSPVRYQYQKNEADRPKELRFINYKWGSIDPIQPINTGYWMYQEDKNTKVGYFYYSHVIQPSEATKQLITTFNVASNTPNKLKGSLHRMDIKAEAGEVDEAVFDSWNIPNVAGNSIYEQYKKELNKK